MRNARVEVNSGYIVLLLAVALVAVAVIRGVAQDSPVVGAPVAAPTAAAPAPDPAVSQPVAGTPSPEQPLPAAGEDVSKPTDVTDAGITNNMDQGEPPTDSVIPLKQELAGGGVETSGKENLINVTVENETLENVVSMFARISGANIVTTSADLGGTVTVNLRGVEWRPALSSILDVHNLALAEKMPGSGVYTIAPKAVDSSEPLVMEQVFLSFTTVPEMAAIVRTMMGTVSNAMVTEFPSRNAMVVRTTEGNMREIRMLVTTLDVPGRQVVVETKFMELTDSASKKLGIKWDSLDAWNMGLTLNPLNYSRNVTRGATRSQNASETYAHNESYDQDGNRLSDAMTYPAYVEGNPTDPNDGFQPPPTIADPSTKISKKSDSASGTTYSKDVKDAQSAILAPEQFKAVISALNKTEGVSVISNPKIIVASGSKDAYFTVGDREPLIRTEIQKGTTDSPGDTVVAELDTAINTEYIKQGYLETGIHLQVVPVVKTEDLIEAMIEPKLVRRVLPDKTVGDNSWPRIAVKEIRTTFTLRSGQTVAIGGLTDTKDDVAITKVPFLGDIPLIGKYLFSHKEDQKSQVETIIFVTLSLAEADSLYREAGIPDEAKLVHKRMLREEANRADFENELEDLRKATQQDTQERARSRSLKRRQ